VINQSKRKFFKSILAATSATIASYAGLKHSVSRKIELTVAKYTGNLLTVEEFVLANCCWIQYTTISPGSNLILDFDSKNRIIFDAPKLALYYQLVEGLNRTIGSGLISHVELKLGATLRLNLALRS
jgi:hypothetical protein